MQSFIKIGQFSSWTKIRLLPQCVTLILQWSHVVFITLAFPFGGVLLSRSIVVYLTNKVSKVSIMPFSFQEAFNHPHCTHLDTTHNPIDQGSSSLVINIKHTHDNTQLLLLQQSSQY